MSDYLPRRASPLNDWTCSFASTIAADPAKCGLDANAAEEIAQRVAAHASAYALSTAPLTRTKAAVIATNNARKAMLQVVRRYVRVIKANPAVALAVKADLGLRADDKPRNAVPRPGTAPVLSVLSATPQCHHLRYADAAVPDRQAKPANTIGLQLFCHVGSEAPARHLEAPFRRFVTRQPFRVSFQREEVGQTAFYCARWQSGTGETGPWSQMVQMIIVG